MNKIILVVLVIAAGFGGYILHDIDNKVSINVVANKPSEFPVYSAEQLKANEMVLNHIYHMHSKDFIQTVK